MKFLLSVITNIEGKTISTDEPPVGCTLGFVLVSIKQRIQVEEQIKLTGYY